MLYMLCAAKVHIRTHVSKHVTLTAIGRSNLPAWPARSAVEVVRIAREAIEGLFGMRLQLAVDLVRALTEGIDGVLQQ